MLGNIHGIDGIETNVLLRQITLHRARQFGLQFRRRPRRVQEENAARFQAFQQVVFINVGLLRAGNKIRFIDKVRRFNRLTAETQMRNGDPARLFRVVSEISLCVKIRLVADDFYGALVGADCAVRTKPPEFASLRSGGGNVDIRTGGQRTVVNIVNNAYRKVILRLVLLEVVENARM